MCGVVIAAKNLGQMTKGVLIGLGLAAGAGLLLVASSGAAKSSGAIALPVSSPKEYYSRGFAYASTDTKTPFILPYMAEQLSVMQHAFDIRLQALLTAHSDASPMPDKYSHASLLVFRLPNATGYQPVDKLYGWYWSDEYGRPFEGWGVSTSPLSMALVIVQTVLPFIPGVGTAAAATLAACIVIAQGKSLKDAAIAAARASLPPAAQVAFDAGLGVANGQSLDEATKQALFNKVPGGQKAYEQGKAVVKGFA